MRPFADPKLAASGVLQGTKRYVLQDDDGQIALHPQHQRRARLRRVGPEHAWLRDALADPRGAAGVRVRRGGAAVAQLAAACRAGDPAGPADHVHRRRRPPTSRSATLDHLPGLRRLPPVRIGNGAVDQRQIDVLGEVMIALAMARHAGARGRRGRLAAAARPGRRPRRELGRARQRPVGDPRAAAALHPLPGDGVGRLRPGIRAVEEHGLQVPSTRGGVRDAVREEILDARLRPRAEHLHPALRHRPRSTPRCWCSRWSASSTATTRGCSARSRPSSRT